MIGLVGPPWSGGLGKEIGRQRVVAATGKVVGHFADLIVEAPSFLDHDQAGIALARRVTVRVTRS